MKLFERRQFICSNKESDMSEESLFTTERKTKILEILQLQNKVTVAKLASEFGVSGATIRSDLRQMHARGLIIRTHGGAMQKISTNMELSADQKLDWNLEQKKRIAEAALQLISDGNSIILDTGTTTLELAKLLYRKGDLTVITNDLEIALTLEKHPSAKIYVLGGLIRKMFHCTLSLPGKPLMDGIIVNKAFMGTNALSLDKGASTPDISQAETKKAMIQCAQEVILLCDSSKIGKVSLAQFARIEDIDIFVTDAIGTQDKSSMEEKEVTVIVA
jgi:DeoR family transcriptional regulator, fructose operon transcriptional repressor